MTHETKKAKARNMARLASVPNGGRTMFHRAVRKALVLDGSEVEDGLAEYLEKRTSERNRDPRKPLLSTS
jgi:hypothetical protein